MPDVGSAFSGIISSMQNLFSSLLNKALIAAIIILVGFVVGRLLGRLVKQLLHEVGLDSLTRTAGIKISVEGLIGAITTYSIYFIAVVMALDELGLNTLVFSLLAGGIIAIVLVSTLLAVKDFIPNLFAGFFLHRRSMLREGDWIKVDDLDCKVVKMDVVEAKLETRKGDVIFMPNSLLMKKKIFRKKR